MPDTSQPVLGEVPAYRIIYADPPWRYDFAASDSRSIEAKYPTMSYSELAALNVPLDRTGCALFMWTTVAKLHEGMALLSAWGFEYKTHAIWDKVTLGMGYWFRGQHELLLVGTIGTISPPPASLRVSSVIRCKRGQHSSKPDEVRDLIASWYPDVPKLEMFARVSHAGWDAFGNEIIPTLFDQEPRQVDIDSREIA